MTETSIPLARAMDERRLDLSLTWRAVAKAAGISYETLRAVRKGADAAALTKRGIERALQWPTGGYDEAVAGRDPELAGADPDALLGAEEGELIRRFRTLTPDAQMRALQELLEEVRQGLSPGSEGEGRASRRKGLPPADDRPRRTS